MKNSFLDYYKTILEKVSFDRSLFQKEYNKALQFLNGDEKDQIDQWLQLKGLL